EFMLCVSFTYVFAGLWFLIRCYSSLFSFQLSCPHLVLPSFPTRRSSDLIYSLGCTLYYLLTGREPFVEKTPYQRYGVFSTNGSRSEEHTSELQSRSDLVCRLLLEKKK